ncbi:MAG TPA: four helix bundle protein [Candidatus Moranbacteria bacterium]|nr:four helix bundle protein [Candidatus Moranbacteria bacterium]HSA08413.1 four helix bundle protein [Candidatus Moranbacteria bacterium]
MQKPIKNNFHGILKQKADNYAYLVYKATKKFPKEEVFGITSQLKRASLSVVLNYIEGYARIGEVQYRNFLRMSYGSLKESQYLLEFSFREKYLKIDDYNNLINLSEELGAMLWSTIKGLNEKCGK